MIAIGEPPPQKFEYRAAPRQFIPGQYFHAAFYGTTKDRAYMTSDEADAADEAEEAAERGFRRRNNRWHRRVAFP